MNNGYLTNAAVLLFAENPESWQLGAFTKIGYFESDSDLLYQDEIHGSLLDQIDRIIEIVHLKYMKAKISYEGGYSGLSDISFQMRLCVRLC